MHVRLEWRERAAGPVELVAQPEHRVSLHASPSIAAVCRATRLRYRRQPDDVDIAPAGDRGGFDAAGHSRSLDVWIPVALVRRVAEQLGVRDELTPRHLLRDAQLTHTIWALEAEERGGFASGALFIDSLSQALVARLLTVPRQRGGLPPLPALREYIEANLDRSLTLEHLAQVSGMGSTQLRARFRASTGVSLHRYVVQRRVERAHRLLRTGSLPIAQVALEAGFAHPTHLARWMRRLLGTTPRALRSRRS
jgi:AraC family transcriptional regulator